MSSWDGSYVHEWKSLPLESSLCIMCSSSSDDLITLCLIYMYPNYSSIFFEHETKLNHAWRKWLIGGFNGFLEKIEISVICLLTYLVIVKKGISKPVSCLYAKYSHYLSTAQRAKLPVYECWFFFAPIEKNTLRNLNWWICAQWILLLLHVLLHFHLSVKANSLSPGYSFTLRPVHSLYICLATVVL